MNYFIQNIPQRAGYNQLLKGFKLFSFLKKKIFNKLSASLLTFFFNQNRLKFSSQSGFYCMFQWINAYFMLHHQGPGRLLCKTVCKGECFKCLTVYDEAEFHKTFNSVERNCTRPRFCTRFDADMCLSETKRRWWWVCNCHLLWIPRCWLFPLIQVH